jgi:hypothetical protein
MALRSRGSRRADPVAVAAASRTARAEIEHRPKGAIRTSLTLAPISLIAFTARPSEVSGRAAPLDGWYAGSIATPTGWPGRESEPPTPTRDSTRPANLYSAAAGAGWVGGALWGALTGASTGWVGYASESKCRDEAGHVYTALVVAAPGALLGAAVGGILTLDEAVVQDILPALRFGVTRHGSRDRGETASLANRQPRRRGFGICRPADLPAPRNGPTMLSAPLAQNSRCCRGTPRSDRPVPHGDPQLE